jgi:hypothetical protein
LKGRLLKARIEGKAEVNSGVELLHFSLAKAHRYSNRKRIVGIVCSESIR